MWPAPGNTGLPPWPTFQAVRASSCNYAIDLTGTVLQIAVTSACGCAGRCRLSDGAPRAAGPGQADPDQRLVDLRRHRLPTVFRSLPQRGIMTISRALN